MSRSALLLVLPAAAALWVASARLDVRAESPSTERDAARVELGRRLFFDPAIGRQGKVGCAACHKPEFGFSDTRIRSLDETGVLPRHSQPLTDLKGEGFHWDGEFDKVRDVIDARVLPADRALAASAARVGARLASAPRLVSTSDVRRSSLSRFVTSSSQYGSQLDMPSSVDAIAARVAAGDRYAPGFAAAFGDPAVTAARVGDALESYIASLKTTTNAYDRFVAGDESAMTLSARRGLDLFKGRAGCAQCHPADGARATFTDGRFHNTGVEARRSSGRFASPDAGRLAVNFRVGERRAFKTPSLRDVARRAPYFHDASAERLSDVVRYYDAGGTEDECRDERIKPLHLSEQDVSDLVAFLGALSGEERAGLGRPGPSRAERLTVRVVRPDGTPSPGAKLRVVPFGDRLAGADAMPLPVDVATGDSGDAVVPMPLSTHVVVHLNDRAVSRALPDWTREVTVVDVPRDAVILRVISDGGSPSMPATFLLVPPDTDSHATFEPRSDPALFERLPTSAPGEILCIMVAQSRGSTGRTDSVERLPVVAPDAPFRLDTTAGAFNELCLALRPDQAESPVRRGLRADVETIRRLSNQ